MTFPRDCTEAERARLQAHACPDCGKEVFRRGASGGRLAVNIECVHCRARFNVTRVAAAVVFAQRIDGNGEWPDRGLW